MIISLEGQSQQKIVTQRYNMNDFIKIDSTGSCLIPVRWQSEGKINDIKVEPTSSLKNRNYLIYDVTSVPLKSGHY